MVFVCVGRGGEGGACVRVWVMLSSLKVAVAIVVSGVCHSCGLSHGQYSCGLSHGQYMCGLSHSQYSCGLFTWPVQLWPFTWPVQL